MPKPVYEEGDVTVLLNQAVHTDREVTANRPDIIIKNKKRENMHTDRFGNTCRQKYCAKGSGKEVKIQEFRYRDKTNVEPEMYGYTSNNWSHWNSSEKLKENLEVTPGTHSIDSLQRTAILRTSHIIRKALQCET